MVVDKLNVPSLFALITVRHVGCNVTIFRMKARPRMLKQSWWSR